MKTELLVLLYNEGVELYGGSIDSRGQEPKGPEGGGAVTSSYLSTSPLEVNA